MADSITTGNITNSEAIAVGSGATAMSIHYDSTPPHFPLHNLPQPNPNFTGRQDLLQAIASNFTPSPHTHPPSPLVITQAIAGLGGVGKT
ncbi:MAG: hypothetical protein KC413_09550, partial [Anaerolineales bacterium]|nr:hypothetical protein [Anaerolineales bacterium]